ncbi:MAG: polysaccharide biosynthesis C-terminal domain-containing protein [Chitinophagales bacterium]|nr:polysaccharide biosynthesis C-terminal domain-containing protein [Chitinophagales bacterium]
MRKFFVKNLLFTIAVNLLVKPLWVFLIDRNVQNTVGHADYGTYQALVNLGLIFNIVLDFGLTYYNTNIISSNPGKLRTLFPAMLSARLALVLVYGVLVMGAALAIGYSGREMLLLTGILLIQSLNSLMLFLRSNVSALHKFRLDALLSVTDKLLMILICSVLLFSAAFAAGFKIEWFVVAQIISYAVAVVIGMAVLKKMAGVSFNLSLNVNEVTGIIRKSLPYASLVFLMAVHMRVDTILVERLSGPESKNFAGIYAAGYRLLDVGNMFGIMFAGMLLPMFGRMLSQQNDIQPIVRLSVNMLLPAAFIATGAAVFFGTDIMQLLYTDADAYGGQVFAWLMACFPAYCIMYIYSTLLTANGNLILLNKIAVVGVIINLSLNLWLIPQHQALGAAQVAFITQSTLAVLYMFFSGKNLKLAKSIKLVAAHLGYILMLGITGYGCTLLPVEWMYQMFLFGAVSLVWIFVFRFVSVGSVKALMEK